MPRAKAGSSRDQKKLRPPTTRVVNDVGAEHVDLAVGKVQDAHDAEHKRQTQGHENIDQARGQSVKYALEESVKHGELSSHFTALRPAYRSCKAGLKAAYSLAFPRRRLFRPRLGAKS